MPQFKSEYFDNVGELTQAKDDAWRGVEDRKTRLDIIRKFSNGMATMTIEEAQAKGMTEIVNHLTTYSKLSNQVSMFESMVTGVKDLVEVIVDTDNPEQDLVLGERISEAINRGALSRKGKFSKFWRKCCGEIIMTGGPPVVMGARYGWLPDIEMDMFFPKDTDLDSDRVTYAFVPQEMSLADLKDLEAEVSGGGSAGITDLKNIRSLIEILEKNIQDSQGKSPDFGREVTRGVRDGDEDSTTTIDLWEYYEVKYSDNGDRYVSKTVFTENIDTQLPSGDRAKITRNDPSNSQAQYIISYVDKAYAYADEWLKLVCIDSEIGGVKTTDTLRGVAELVYPSSAEMEDLFNRLMAGDKIRATPKMKVTSAANADAVAQWDIEADLYMPDGVEEAVFNTTSQSLQTPLAYLQQVTSSITGAPMANTAQGGELRQQALERQESSAGVRSNRLAEAYDCLDDILETVVSRLLAGDTKPGADGYLETRWVRNHLKKYEIDYKSLAAREDGQFKFLRVRAKRSIGNGDREHQIATSDWLMAQIQSYPPASRPLILREATQLRTQNTDLAERLVKVPKTIINSQKLTAENEYDTITRRATLGQSVSVQEEDIHQEHIPVHLVDMQALIARHQFEKWTKLDALAFGGMLDHVGEHLQILLGNPATNFEGQQFLQDYQGLAQAVRPIMAEIEEAEQSQGAQLTPREEAELELKMKAEQRKWAELGLKTEEFRALEDNRRSRERLSARSQYAKEVSEDRRLKQQSQQLALSRRDQAVDNAPEVKKAATTKE